MNNKKRQVTNNFENNTFIEITNKDIYLLIKEIQNKNTEEHEQIIMHQKETNGKVRLAKWMVTTALLLIVTLLGILYNHIVTMSTKFP